MIMITKKVMINPPSEIRKERREVDIFSPNCHIFLFNSFFEFSKKKDTGLSSCHIFLEFVIFLSYIAFLEKFKKKDTLFFPCKKTRSGISITTLNKLKYKQI